MSGCVCSFAVAYKPSVLIPGMDHDMRSFPAAAPAPASIPQTMADGFRSNGAGSTSHVYSPPPDQPSQIVQVHISSSKGPDLNRKGHLAVQSARLQI